MRPSLAAWVLAALAVLVAAEGGRARAGDEKVNWREEAAFKAIQAAEVKALTPLLRNAIKEDYRRQAWFLADRLLAAKPGDSEAQAALEKWHDDELLLGMNPPPDFTKKLEKALQDVGDLYFHFGETLEGAGVDPEQYYDLNVLAESYNSPAAKGNAALARGGFVWLGTFLDFEEKALEQTVGPRWKEITYPPMWDDGYLKVRTRWPEARVAVLGPWKLITDLKPGEALRVLTVLETARQYLVDTLGGNPAPPDATLVDTLLFTEAETYDKIGSRLVPERWTADYHARSSFFDPQANRLFACWRHRENAWIGEDATLLYEAARVIARRHFAPTARGTDGRGAWLIDGLGGALEGFVVDPKTRATEIDPAHCWRLAAAKALRSAGKTIPWDELLDLDGTKAKERPRATVKVTFRGGTFDAKDVNVVHAQATAFAVGLLKAEKGKGAKKLGELVRELLKRDSLPDLDKTLGWKKGRWQAEAEKAIDAATGL